MIRHGCAVASRPAAREATVEPLLINMAAPVRLQLVLVLIRHGCAVASRPAAREATVEPLLINLTLPLTDTLPGRRESA